MDSQGGVRVRQVRKVDKGTLRAMVEIEIGGLIVRGLKIVDSGKGPWLAWPAERWNGTDGAVKYTTIVEPRSLGLRKAICAAVLAVWRDQGQSQAA